MKRPLRIITQGTATACCVAALSVATAVAATPVKSVTLAKSGDFTEVTLPVPSRLLCEHFTEPASADRPFRIVLNLCDATHNLPQKVFSSLPSCAVQQIRTSQFAGNPDPVVRVVLDLKSSATYTVRTEPDRLVIAIADPNSSFATWEASATPVEVAIATPPTTPTTEKNEVPPATTRVEPPVAAPSEPIVAQPSQSLSPEPMPPTVSATPKMDFVLPPQPLVIAPEVLDASTVNPTTTAGATPTETPSTIEAPMLATTTDPMPAVSMTAVSPSDTATTQDALIDRLKSKFFSGARAPKPYMSEEGLIWEQLRAMDSGYGPPTPGSDMDREALLERIRQVSKEQGGIPVNLLPSLPGGPIRTEVFYSDLGRRDPFEPLLKGQRTGFVNLDMPSVETLRMVGVLRDEEQSLALMEDTDGHNYILRPGDPVEHGRVLSVGEQRTVIQVDEYGWTRTVVLQLSPRGGDPSKALGSNAGYDGDYAPPAPNQSTQTTVPAQPAQPPTKP